MSTAQVRLDYSIVKSFESKYNNIKESIRQAATLQECAAAHADIDELEKDFAADTVLLDDALYPDKYDKWISELRFELHISQDRMGIIETQGSRVADLAERVRILSGRIDSIADADMRLISSIKVMSSTLNVMSSTLNVMSSALTKDTAKLDSLTNIVGRLQPRELTHQNRKSR
jgi:hypothetical protein